MTDRATNQTDLPDAATLAEIEALAAEFAQVAGAEIIAARTRTISVIYKDLPGAAGEPPLWRDPVTEVDHDVEVLVRARLAERFPDHDVIGEEIESDHAGTDYLWAIDPIDGTTNFVNGFPLYAASIGLLHRGRPVAGAIWCAASHAPAAGVYHASRGGRLSFDGRPFKRFSGEGVRRRLVGLPGFGEAGPYDMRKTGSAAIECAFVAAGLLAAARFEGANLWDVAGGVALVAAAGGCVLERREEGWVQFDSFARDGAAPWQWKGALILAENEEAAHSLA